MGGLHPDTGVVLLRLTALTLILCCSSGSEVSSSSNKSRETLAHHDYLNHRSSQQTVRWQTDPFSTCSVPCGGGLQHRLIRCIKEDNWRSGLASEVPSVLCPIPAPRITQPCNTHSCLGQWKTKPWSRCSVTCGVGIQEREVTCESNLLKGLHFQVSSMECGGGSPDRHRKCYLRDCPHSTKLKEETILSENYTLIQIRRAGKLRINIGGNVKILPGQTVIVKCPVRHYSRRLIYWSKGFKLLPHAGRVRVTTGGLRIQKADPKRDGGIYTCIAGDRKATITVQFTSKNDPLSRNYRQLSRRSRRRYRRRHLNVRNGWQEGTIARQRDLTATSPFSNNGRQRDQSTNNSRTLSFVSSDWSDCSVTCSSGGERLRKVYCSQVTRKYVKIVPDEECYRRGLKKPADVEPCLQGTDCPVWRPGPWTECDPSCGEVGHKSRFLVCEWERSRTPAWDSCDISKKPITRKPCKVMPCLNKCVDKSSKCSRVRKFKMCRFRHFHDQCCQSCQDFHHPNSIYSRMKNSGIKYNDTV